ncbi:MAG: hypothetical protein FWC53_00895 [Firmicutes bacterium]|nr:hypothetical protein [Bacillota bacterium]
MLINTIKYANFKKNLKFSIVLSAIAIILGIISITVFSIYNEKMIAEGTIGWINTSGLIKGFYFGTGIGLIIAGLIIMVQSIIPLINKERFKEEEIKYNDERNKFIRDKILSISATAMFLIIDIALIISGIYNIVVFMTLLAVFAVFIAILTITTVIVDKIY